MKWRKQNYCNGVPGPARVWQGSKKSGVIRHGRHTQGLANGRPSTYSCEKKNDRWRRFNIALCSENRFPENLHVLKKGICNGEKKQNYYKGVPGPAGVWGVEKERFQQTRSTHSGAHERDTRNIQMGEKR